MAPRTLAGCYRRFEGTFVLTIKASSAALSKAIPSNFGLLIALLPQDMFLKL
jgi:hypothetical protein